MLWSEGGHQKKLGAKLGAGASQRPESARAGSKTHLEAEIARGAIELGREGSRGARRTAGAAQLSAELAGCTLDATLYGPSARGGHLVAARTRDRINSAPGAVEPCEGFVIISY